MKEPISTWVTQLEKLMDPPEGAPPIWFQSRGRQLEDALRDMMATERLSPRMNIRPNGEEIDGSFVLGDRTFLLEAKWRRGPTPASELYAFKGKVDGKLMGTIGVFITMNRYSPDAIDALIAGKTLNLILFSADDIIQIAQGHWTFTDALRAKLRFAAEEGSPYLPLEPTAEAHTEVAEVSEKSVTSEAVIWTFIVEGKNDERALDRLLSRFETPSRSIARRFWIAEGTQNMAALAQHLGDKSCPEQTAVFVDADVDPDTLQILRENAGTVIVFQPSIAEWLMNATSAELYNGYVFLASSPEKELRRLATASNLDQLLTSNREFAILIDRMGLGSRSV